MNPPYTLRTEFSGGFLNRRIKSKASYRPPQSPHLSHVYKIELLQDVLERKRISTLPLGLKDRQAVLPEESSNTKPDSVQDVYDSNPRRTVADSGAH